MKKALRILFIACVLAVIGVLLSLGVSVLTENPGLPQANSPDLTNGLGLLTVACLLSVAAYQKFVRQ